MIAIDTEYVSETAISGLTPGPRPDVKNVYCEPVQIAAVKLDERGRELETLNLTVRPSYIKTLPEWLVRMTGMTEEKRASGVSFEEALEDLAQFIGAEREVWTYAGDWHVFTNAAKKHSITLPFHEFLLVKPRLSMWGVKEKDFKDMDLELCSGNLHKVLGIELPNDKENTHDALHDARSLAYSVHYLETL